MVLAKARFRRQISVASNAMLTYLIIYCLNCIRCDGNSTSKPGLRNIRGGQGNKSMRVLL